MIIITAEWKAKPGSEKDLQKYLKEMVSHVRENEPDCLEYLLHQDTSDKSRFFFYEQYSSQNAFDDHKETLHFKNLMKNTKELVAQDVKVEFFNLVI